MGMLIRVLQINRNIDREFYCTYYDLDGDRVGESISPEVGQYCHNQKMPVEEALAILKDAMIQSRLKVIEDIQFGIEKLKKLKVREY